MFKNATIYNLRYPMAYDAEALEKLLSQEAFRACPRHQPSTCGFIAPIGEDENAPLVYASAGFMLFCVQWEERLLPPTVLQQQLQEKIQEAEIKTGSKMARHEKLRLKDDLYATLLAQAFTKKSQVFVWVDVKHQRVIVDTSSAKKLQQIFTLLDSAIGDFGLTMPDFESCPSVITSWLREGILPEGFSLADHCVLQDSLDEKALVRYSQKDLSGQSIQQLMDEGCGVMQLRVDWCDQLLCQIKSDGMITGIKLTDEAKDVASSDQDESPAQRFASDFVVAAGTLSGMLSDLLPIITAAGIQKASESGQPEVAESLS